MIEIYSPTMNTNDLQVKINGEDLTELFSITKIEILPNEQIKAHLECIVDKIDINNVKYPTENT